MSASREYKIWLGIKNRCTNENYNFYYLYGGRGISMHQAWFDDFTAFYKHMGPAPKGFTIERREVNGNYEPGNCEWIPKGDQMQNTTRTIRVAFNGAVISLRKFCTIEGIVYRRMRPKVIRHITDRSIPVTADYVRRMNGTLCDISTDD